MWDSTAVAVGLKAIGQVESSMRYDALNPTDPITVGFFQWFGTRAAQILNRMKTENSSSWVGIEDSLLASLADHADTDVYWTTRYLNTAEGKSIKPVLVVNVSIQDDQASIDLEAYRVTAVGQGMNSDTNTDAVLFFCNMYNQSPREALKVLANAGPQSGIDRLYSYCLNSPVLGRYKTRYQTAYTIITTHDTSGVGTGVSTPDPHTGGNPSSTRPSTNLNRISVRGDQLVVHYKDGHTLLCVPATAGRWVPQVDQTMGSAPPVPPDGTPPSGVQALLAQWMVDHQNQYAYSQGATRLQPDTNGYTDCSGLMYYCYEQVANIFIGTWTGDQIKHGTLITTDPTVAKAETSLVVGDVVFYRWSETSPSTYDHCAMYVGSNQIQSHGGPDNGPDLQSHSGEIDYATTNGGSIMVRRYV